MCIRDSLEVSATSLLTNHITGKTAHAWNDFTPIAMLYDEFIGFAVKADSPLKTGRDLAELLRNDPAALPDMQSGALRIIAVAAPKRLDGALAQVPTWRELGYDIVVSNWRPVMGPRGLNAEQVAYWEDLLQRFTQTAEWKDELAVTGGLSHYMGNRELALFLEAQSASFRAILGELGLAR